MNFRLDFGIYLNDQLVTSENINTQLDILAQQISLNTNIEGTFLIYFANEVFHRDIRMPILDLAICWIRATIDLLHEIPLIVVPFNERYGVKFFYHQPSDSVKISFFLGTGQIIEKYINEPIQVPNSRFLVESLRVCEEILNIAWPLASKSPVLDRSCQLLDACLEDALYAWVAKTRSV